MYVVHVTVQVEDLSFLLVRYTCSKCVEKRTKVYLQLELKVYLNKQLARRQWKSLGVPEPPKHCGCSHSSFRTELLAEAVSWGIIILRKSFREPLVVCHRPNSFPVCWKWEPSVLWACCAHTLVDLLGSSFSRICLRLLLLAPSPHLLTSIRGFSSLRLHFFYTPHRSVFFTQLYRLSRLVFLSKSVLFHRLLL